MYIYFRDTLIAPSSRRGTKFELRYKLVLTKYLRSGGPENKTYITRTGGTIHKEFITDDLTLLRDLCLDGGEGYDADDVFPGTATGKVVDGF